MWSCCDYTVGCAGWASNLRCRLLADMVSQQTHQTCRKGCRRPQTKTRLANSPGGSGGEEDAAAAGPAATLLFNSNNSGLEVCSLHLSLPLYTQCVRFCQYQTDELR